ncbi:MAG: site-2 protease family protein [Chloroflexi bacterium]|nr:site-2 protease family protein [Chloroflexota bacterium]
MIGSLRIGTIKGISIGIHYSWVFIFVLITWSLANHYFPSQYPNWSFTTNLVVGVITSFLFFGSVIFHELSHSFMALRYNLPVKSITLFIFGGVAQIGREAKNPQDEFWIAIVGPLSSVCLAVFFGIVWLLSREVSEPIAALSTYLGTINLLLAGFNLIPGFPLDGGRVLRAIVWKINNQLVASTRIASIIGQGVAYLFMLGGLVFIFRGSVFDGLWFIFIGWFLNHAAESSYRQVLLQDALKGVSVRGIMTKDFETVDPSTPITELVTNHVLRHNLHAFPVVYDSQLKGIITLHDIKKVPHEQWPFTKVAQAMTDGSLLRVVDPNDDVALAFQILHETDVGQLPVVEFGQLVGLLTRSDLLHFVNIRSSLRI